MSGNRKKGKRLFYDNEIQVRHQQILATHWKEGEGSSTKHYVLLNPNDSSSKTEVYTPDQIKHRKLFFSDDSPVLPIMLRTHIKEGGGNTIRHYVLLNPNDSSSKTEVYTLSQIKHRKLFFSDGSPVLPIMLRTHIKEGGGNTIRHYVLSNANDPNSKIEVFTSFQIKNKKLFFSDGSPVLPIILSTHIREGRGSSTKHYVFLIPNEPTSKTEVFTLRQIKSRNHASLDSMINEEQSPLLTRSIEEDEVNSDLDLDSPIFFDNPTSHESEEERSSIQDNPIAYEPEEKISLTHLHSNQIEYSSSNSIETFYNSPSLDSPNDVVNNNEINLNFDPNLDFDLNFDFNNQIAVDNLVSSEFEEELSWIQFGLDQIEEDLKGLGEANAVENQTLTSVNSWEEEMLREVPSNNTSGQRHSKKPKLDLNVSSKRNVVSENIVPILTHFGIFPRSSKTNHEIEENDFQKTPWES